MARERGVVTVGVVTKPFTFEGSRRAKAAEAGIYELQQHVDTLIVIPNQNLFRVANERTGLREAFKMADDVLYMGVRGITDLMMSPGVINLDFADIRSVMAEMGKAVMGTGEAEGENRAVRAAEMAISNPLLEDTNMAGARGLLVNISGSSDLTLYEVDQATTRVREEVAEDALIFFGTSIDESLSGRVRVSVVATGIDMGLIEAQKPRLVSVAGAPVAQGAAQFASNSFASAPFASAPFAPAAPASPSPVPAQLLHPRPDVAQAPQIGAAEIAAGLHVAPEPRTAPRLQERAARPAPQPPLSALLTDRSATAPAASRSLLNIMTGGFRTRRAEPDAEPSRTEPRQPAPEPRAEPEPRMAHPDEALEIPAFLRRQSS